MHAARMPEKQGSCSRSLAQPIGILFKKSRGLEIALGMRVNGKTIRHVLKEVDRLHALFACPPKE